MCFLGFTFGSYAFVRTFGFTSAKQNQCLPKKFTFRFVSALTASNFARMFFATRRRRAESHRLNIFFANAEIKSTGRAQRRSAAKTLPRQNLPARICPFIGSVFIHFPFLHRSRALNSRRKIFAAMRIISCPYKSVYGVSATSGKFLCILLFILLLRAQFSTGRAPSQKIISKNFAAEFVE
jgi:hypothetical protein